MSDVAPVRVVERADQVRRDAHRDRVEAGERLVVHQQLRIERDRAREGDAARHAARDLAEIAGARAPRRPTAFSFIRTMSRIIVSSQIGVLAQRERDVLEHRQIGEQRAELEQHAEAPAQPEQLLAIGRVDDLRRRSEPGPRAR